MGKQKKKHNKPNNTDSIPVVLIFVFIFNYIPLVIPPLLQAEEGFFLIMNKIYNSTGPMVL